MQDKPLELSWVTIMRPRERLLAYCRQFYPFYDALPVTDPFHIEPFDVVAVAVMVALSRGRTPMDQIHRELVARCDPLLPGIPTDADLRTFDPSLQAAGELLHKAVRAKGVQVAVATKILHRKRRFLIPILDERVWDHYAADIEAQSVTAVAVLQAFRVDLLACDERISDLRAAAAAHGYDVSPVRVLEALVWDSLGWPGWRRDRRRGVWRRA